VLSMWPTGKEVDLEEAIAYHKKLPDHKNFMKMADRLHREGRTVVFPRAGTPILEQEIELVRTLYEAGLPLIPVTPDSYCRLCKFDKAKLGLEESIRAGKPKLNGFPTVIHGVKNTRKVVESTEAALNQRMTNLDNRLMGRSPLLLASPLDCRTLCRTSRVTKRIAQWSKTSGWPSISSG